MSEHKAAEDELREKEQRLVSIYNGVSDIIFELAVESEGQFRFLSVNAAFLKVTGLSQEQVVGKTVNEVIPEPSLTMVLGRYRQAVERQAIVRWEETSDYPTGRLTGEVSVAPLLNDKGTCTRLIGLVHDITERKRADAAEREAQERFSLLQKAAQLVAWDWDLRTNLITLYGEYACLFGLTRERTTLTTEECFNVIHPEDREQVQTLVRETLEGTNILDAEFRVIWDGTTHWIHSKGKVFLDDSGRRIRGLGVSGEVTERKQAEEVLRQSQQMLASELEVAQHLQRVATQLISTQGIDALYEQVLETAMAILHSDFASIQMFYPDRGTDGELRLLSHRGLGSAAARRWEWVGPAASTTCAEALRTGRRVVVRDVRNCDFMARSEDLEAYLGAGVKGVQSTPLVSRSGALLGMVTTHWHEPHELSVAELRALDVLARMAADLIERSRSEEKLRDSEERLRASEVQLKEAQRLTKVGSWEWNLKTNHVAWSDEVFRILGKPQDRIPSYKESYRVISQQDRHRAEQWIRDCASGNEGESLEVQVTRPNGEVRKIICLSEVSLDEDGVPAYMFGAVQDVTDLRRAQEESFAMQKLESVGTLAGGIAHDFNNLLGGVLVQADLALMELAAGSPPTDELQRIRDVAIHGAEIVRQLMIYAGKESEVIELTDVSRIITEMVDLLKVSVSKHAVLETELDMDLPTVRANSAQLRQIVMNIVTNASEAIGDRDGVIRLTTRRVTIGQVAAIAKGMTAGDYVQLQVSDTGGGVSLDTQARMFEPFFTTKSAGRGLGLAVVQGIVRKLCGAIHFASEAGRGTTFQILLPSAAGVAATGSIRSAEDAARPSEAATVLVVEDEDPLRQGVAKILRKKGFEVLEAANGSAAIDLLRANSDRIDAMLLDMTLPGQPSREVVAAAAQLRPDLKVILTSAYSEEVVMVTMSSPLIRSFIRKPFQLGELLQTLQDVLSS